MKRQPAEPPSERYLGILAVCLGTARLHAKEIDPRKKPRKCANRYFTANEAGQRHINDLSGHQYNYGNRTEGFCRICLEDLCAYKAWRAAVNAQSIHLRNLVRAVRAYNESNAARADGGMGGGK